jgi:hypothetical protein
VFDSGMQKRRPTNIKCWGKNTGKLRARAAIILKMSLCTSNQFRKLKNISVVEEYVEEILVVGR